MLASAADAADTGRGTAGAVDGVWHWRLPDTPNGLRPRQAWHSLGSAPGHERDGGDIYIGGMDHATNAALYRLDSRAATLRYVGDARAASEAANNWRPGETAEKFHTRPLWVNGRIYVATLDRSTIDDAYLKRRGFQWYAYVRAQDSFAALRAAEPGGAAAAHAGLVTLAADPARGLIYGAAIPTGDIYRYDIAAGRTRKLGRPASFDRQYVYVNRIMWVDSRGRLYFTAGNPSLASYPPDVYAHVHFYDPGAGFGERRDWVLREPRALETGQCVADRTVCFFADDQGHVYRFADRGPSWSYVGQVDTPDVRLWVWMFQVNPAGTKAYVATSGWDRAANPASLYEFDLATGATTRLCGFDAFGPALDGLNLHTGYDAWDGDGRFYLASFAMEGRRNVVVTRIDPERLKAALRLRH